MNVRTIQVLLFVAVLSVFAADFTVGCGGGYVYGPITQKFTPNPNNAGYRIAVNGTPFQVPSDFWSQVNTGDWVRYTGKRWEIVKRADSTGSTGAPATSTPATSAPATP